MKAKILLKYSTYGIPLIIFISIIPQFYYYSLFGINLGSYISLVEIPLLFTNNLLFLFIIFLIPFLIIVSLFGKRIGAENTNAIEAISDFSVKKRFQFYLKDNIITIITILTYCILSFINEKYSFFITPALLMFLLMLFNIFLKEAIIENKIELNDETTTALNSLQLLIAIVILLLLIENRNAKKLQNEISLNSITIITEKRVYLCKYTLQYIGRTKDFTFIYDQKKKRMEIIKNSDIITEKIESK
ncbi:hypothetical protein [Flavobacterium gyeonganense]|uniref:Uncharacterized protein n=1 Tax=Flavobacterium gyeonganense TaxID=1310418 RepID=A0ABV5HBG5_9FLAO|nr:hypothetical protein [Flavobacterium gyeonganense]